MAIQKHDIIDFKFGMLTVKEYSHYDSNKHIHYYKCICDCGGEKIANRSSLKGGSLKSCGCIAFSNKPKIYKGSLNGKNLIQNDLFDADKWRKISQVLSGMINRCERQYNSGYKNYGGRGIKVCDEWKSEDGKANFYMWSINNGFDYGLSIDRIDVNGNYEPSNCRWATSEEQNDNRRNTVYIEYNGDVKLAKEWAELKNISYSLLLSRHHEGITGDDLFKYKKSDFANMVYKYKNKTLTFREWAKRYKVSISNIQKIYEDGNINEFLKKEPNYRNDGIMKEIQIINEKLDYLIDTIKEIIK